MAKRREEKVAFNTLLPASFDKRLRDYAAENNETLTAIAIKGIEYVLNGIADEGSLSLPIIATVPCGPLAEAFIDDPARLLLNDDWKRELDARDDDFFVRTYGQSMEGRHIPDGALLLISPLPPHKPPREGQIALVQVLGNDGEADGTIKSWHLKNGKPVLKDGDGKEVKLSPAPREVKAVGIVKRIIIEP